MTAHDRPLLPGMLFLRHIDGWTGRMVAAMQGFIRGGSFWTHAGLIVDGGWFIQAQPHGARLYPVGDLFDGRPVLISDAPIQRALEQTHAALAGDVDLTSMETFWRQRVAQAGRALDGASYSYLDYPVLGLTEWARCHPGNQLARTIVDRLREHINRSGHLICSALCDRAYLNAGIHLFDDGRLPGDVVPEDLAHLAAMHPDSIVHEEVPV